MGRIAELRKKKEDGDITEAEKKELDQLLVEAKDSDAGEGEGEGEGEEDDDDGDDDDVDAAAAKLTKSIESAIDSAMENKLSPVLKALEGKDPKDAKKTTPVLIDTRDGEKSVAELSEKKIILTERKASGKTHFEISERTTEFIGALLNDNEHKLQLLTEGTAADGGYLVPQEWYNVLIEDRRDATVMRQLAQVIPMTTDTLNLGSVDTRPKAQWRNEAAVKHTSTVQFGTTVLTPYSLATIVGLSNELRSDAVIGGPIVNLVTRFIVQAIKEREDQAFFTGDGSGKPTGIDNYSLAALDAADQSAGSRVNTILKTWRRLGQGYRSNAVWVGNSSTFEIIDGLKDDNGQLLLSNLAAGPSPTLRGRPTYEQNDIAHGKLFFGDFSYYVIGDREGISVKVSDEATVSGDSAFEKNLTYVRVEERVDGELTLTQPVREVTLV